MNEEAVTQLNPESIKSERERLNAIIYTQLIRCGQLIANPSASLVTQNYGIRSSLEYIDSLLVSYSNEEYNAKVTKLKGRMDCKVRIDNHSGDCPTSLMKFRLRIEAEPRSYFNLLMDWLRLMNELLQKSGFIEAGREVYTFKERKPAEEIEITPE
ncbi:Uncharacterised protein [uncultured archaeon]|nr:Uncharacterised protein [uncultured archaeon]